MTVGFGIDLGTTRTSISMVEPNIPEKGWYGNVRVIQLPDGFTTPSVILFESDAHVIGASAKNMGHRARDCAQVFKREMPNADWRFKPPVRGGEEFSAEDLSRILIEHVVNATAAATSLKVEKVVVTVPAYFGEPERRRTRCAAERAGLTVLDIINEPTAAILAYLFQPGVDLANGCVLVFDLGGGTFDTVVVRVDADNITVSAIDGDLLLGGRDFDATICMHLAECFEEEHPGAEIPTAHVDANARLMLTTEIARESLSAASVANIAVWGGGESAGLASNVEVTRGEMEKILSTLFDRCLSITDRALSEARRQNAEATHVLFVGGTTKTPAIRNRVLERYGLEELTVGADPDQLVSKGAAIWAQKLILEREFLAAVSESTMAEVDWHTSEVRSVVNKMVTDTGYPRAMLLRLLKLDLRSITSRGYALKCRESVGGTDYLAFLIEAGAKLPFKSRPTRFNWLSKVDQWVLRVFEDVDGHRGTRDPANAKMVETVTGPMVTSRAEGESFEVVMELGRDQIIRITAWHLDAHGQDDRLEVEIRPD